MSRYRVTFRSSKTGRLVTEYPLGNDIDEVADYYDGLSRVDHRFPFTVHHR